MDTSVIAFRILIMYMRTISLTLEVLKEFVLDLMLKAVDIVERF